MNRRVAPTALAAVLIAALAPAVGQADTLLIDRVETEKSLPLPNRGL
jgi:hypothetical protein